jgi:predicted metalloprotease with PDZ domain
MQNAERRALNVERKLFLLGGSLARGGGFAATATAGTEGRDVAVEHRLGAELVVERVPMDPQSARGSSDIAAAGIHRRDNVFALEGFDCLLQCDAVSNQLANDQIQSVVNRRHELSFGPMKKKAAITPSVLMVWSAFIENFLSSWKS